MKPWINKGEQYWGFDIKKIEKHFGGATYIGDFSIKQRRGWTGSPVAVFYQPTPDTSKGHTHYFGLYLDSLTQQLMITDASSTAGISIAAKMADDGEIIYSRYGHDYRVSKDGTAMIDGGREYTRSSVTGLDIKLMIVDSELKIMEKKDG